MHQVFDLINKIAGGDRIEMQSEDALHSNTAAKVLPGRTSVLNRINQRNQ